MIAVMLPILMFVLYYLYRRDVYDVHHAIVGKLPHMVYGKYKIVACSVFIIVVLY